MSKMKGQKSVSVVDTRQTQTNSAVKKKKKHRRSKRNVRDTNEVGGQRTLPPKDAQQFSANWKVLQQVPSVIGLHSLTPGLSLTPAYPCFHRY